MSVISNLDINLRGNTGNLDKALDKTSSGVSKLAASTNKAGAVITGTFDKTRGLVTGFFDSVPNGGALSNILGALAAPLTTIKQLGQGVWQTLQGVFTTDPVALVKGLLNLKDGFANIAKSVVALGAAFVGMGLASIGPIADLNKASNKLGISTEALSGYLHVSRLSIEDLDGNLTKLEKHLADAANGSKEAAATFQQLGIDAKEMLEANPDEHIEALARAFQTIPTQAERIRMSMELFGKSGASMMKLLAGGPEALKAGLAEAASLGQVVTQAQAQQVAAAKGAVSKMKEGFAGLGKTAAIAIAPFVEMLANGVTRAIQWLNQFREPLLQWFAYVEFVFKNFNEYIGIVFDQALYTVTKWANGFIHIFSDVLPQVIMSFGELLYDGLTSGFADGFDAAWKKAMADINTSFDRSEGAIEQQLRQQYEARQKAFNAQWQQFQQQKAIAKAINPTGIGEGPSPTGGGKNAAVERGSVQAFEIIASTQGDKMYKVANDQLAELRKLVEEARRKKNGKPVGKAVV